jgi:uncharacterized oxidoreductase
MRLEGRTALVTGGARGIGHEITRQMVALGCHVIVVGRDPGRLEMAEREHGGMVTAWPADLAAPAEVETLIAELPVRHPGLSILINNAGVQTMTDVLRDGDKALRCRLQEEIAINFGALVALSIGLLPHLRSQPEAAIVNVSSGLAIAPKTSAPVYCGTKAAVRAFTRALRYQCERDASHVRVTDVVMPLVDTDMTAGRGRGKIGPEAAAAALIRGLRRGDAETYVGKAGLLKTIARLSPALAYRIMRHG